MKKLVLSVLGLASLSLLNLANAQSFGISIGPAGAMPNEDITITITPDLTCNDQATNNLAGVDVARLHSGIAPTSATVDLQALTQTGGWQNVVAMDSPDAMFTFTGNSFVKTLNPSTYYANSTGEEIAWLCFVINGGPTGDEWSKKASNTRPSDLVCNGDFFVPFPLSGIFVANDKTIEVPNLALTAYPNPVRDASTTIRYTLPVAGDVSLKVYDLVGNEVATLVDEKQSAGIKSLKWNVANMKSGVYFYTLTSGKKIETKKIVISE